MSNFDKTYGRAALSIAESVLLSLNDRNVLPEQAVISVLKDAVQRLENRRFNDTESAACLGAAHLIRNIINGRNSVRRP
jgi:hypothetical protein